MNFRQNFHEFPSKFPEIFKKLITQNMLEIQEISCKEISFLILLNYNLFMKFHVKFHGSFMEKITNKKKFSEKNFHEIPGGT